MNPHELMQILLPFASDEFTAATTTTDADDQHVPRLAELRRDPDWRVRLRPSKAQRGTKRACQSQECGARFYDLNRNPIT
jgi:hypothetical protein